MILLWPCWPAWVDLFLNCIHCDRWGPGPKCSAYLNSLFFIWMLWDLLSPFLPPFFLHIFQSHSSDFLWTHIPPPPLYNVWVKLNFQQGFKSGFKIKQNKFSCALMSMAMAHIWLNERHPFVEECCDINKKRKFLGGAWGGKKCFFMIHLFLLSYGMDRCFS